VVGLSERASAVALLAEVDEVEIAGERASHLLCAVQRHEDTSASALFAYPPRVAASARAWITVRRNASTSASSPSPPLLGDHLTERIANEPHLVAERTRHLVPGGVSHAAVGGLALAGLPYHAEPTDAPVLDAEAAPLRTRTLAPVMTSALPATAGVVGLGRFGRLWASMLQGDFTLRVFDTDPGRRAEAERQGLTPASLGETLASDAVFYWRPDIKRSSPSCMSTCRSSRSSVAPGRSSTCCR